MYLKPQPGDKVATVSKMAVISAREVETGYHVYAISALL